MKKPLDKIRPEEVKDALLRSGYLLEARLESTIRSTSYLVETNISYPDPVTGKSRELDLFAYNGYPIDKETGEIVVAQLLIECINNPQPIAFIIKQPLAGPPYESLFVRRSGLPMSAGPDQESLPEFLGMYDYHHYFTGTIATQYCSFAKKKGQDSDWMAYHEENQFESFKKLSDAVEYFISKYYEQWVNSPGRCTDIRLYYPILVVQGELLETRPSKKSLRLRKVQHIRYRRSAIVDAKESYYQIDVVSERYFPEFIHIIDKELLETASRIRDNADAIRQAVSMKLQGVRGVGTPGAIRYILES
jgi:hypothetical protein